MSNCSSLYDHHGGATLCTVLFTDNRLVQCHRRSAGRRLYKLSLDTEEELSCKVQVACAGSQQ